MNDAIDTLIDAGLAAIRRTRARPVAVVATSYDTAFEPVADQVRFKLAQLEELFAGTEIDWTLWIVDDLPARAGFGAAVRSVESPRLRCVPMQSERKRRGGLKGRAVLDGMRAAIEHTPGLAAVAYVNLNLKVDARQAGVGFAAILDGAADIAIGSRAARDGGVVVGAGRLGRVKSRIFAGIARAALPPLAEYGDTNAPMKIFSADAARHLLDAARLHHVTLDVEWLTLAHAGGWRIRRFPIGWIQRAGSRPPWHLVALSLRDVARVRRWWKNGQYQR